MARRTFDVVDIIQILVHWHAGRSNSEIAQSLDTIHPHWSELRKRFSAHARPRLRSWRPVRAPGRATWIALRQSPGHILPGGRWPPQVEYPERGSSHRQSGR